MGSVLKSYEKSLLAGVHNGRVIFTALIYTRNDIGKDYTLSYLSDLQTIWLGILYLVINKFQN